MVYANYIFFEKNSFYFRFPNFTIYSYFYESLEKILRIWKKKYPKTEIIGHYLISDTKKTCPNFDVKKWCIKKKLI